MRSAREAGFSIILFYVGIDSAEDCLERIKRRVLLGGHDVPANDVRRRYSRSLKNLPEAIRTADKAFLFDNTDTGEPQFIASYEAGIPFERGAVEPNWFNQFGIDR
jgi:predicted ABC-type ATPase